MVSTPNLRLWACIAAGMVLAGGAALVPLGRVDNSVSERDRATIAKMEQVYGISAQPLVRDFQAEIRFILDVQHAVLDRVPGQEGLPEGMDRDLSELYERRSGLCYDRSWFIERILKAAGFRTRHVFIYAVPDESSFDWTLFKSGSPTHAMSEVETRKGWLLIDSNKPWISLDRQGNVIPTREIRRMPKPVAGTWDERFEPFESVILKSPFRYVYGLYSRHGRFYWPFVPVPDFDLAELMANLRG